MVLTSKDKILNLDADTYLNVGSLLSLELFHELGA
jgi:hypothetical protein